MKNEDGTKRKYEGGKIAQRGFIFQSIMAMIECLERDDWDAIKLEPETENDKVDIMLYKDGTILSAIQVKSSENPFERWAVQDWLEKLKSDAEGAREICLILVSDSFSPACEAFIKRNPEVRKAPFSNLSNRCTDALVAYIKKVGLVGEVRYDDLRKLDNELFAELLRNSISENSFSRVAFIDAFQRAMPVHHIPLCLTPIPATNYEVGLIGRDEVKADIHAMLEKNNCTVLVNGLGGIGKTAVMQQVCNDIKNDGKYVAWVECGDCLRDDLLLLRSALGVPESDDAETAYMRVINELRSRLSEKMYLFLDNLSRSLSKDERDILMSLGIHIMITSRIKHDYFPSYFLDVLDRQHILDMFYGYYRRDNERKYKNFARYIIDSVHSHTLLVELLAKAAWKKGGTLEAFYAELKEIGFLDIFNRKLWNEHDSTNSTIEESVIMLYEMSRLSKEQQRIMELFSIFIPEKEIYFKVFEWAILDMNAVDELVDLGWLERGGLENGFIIHQIVRDSLIRQIEKTGAKIQLEDYGMLLGNVLNTKSYLGDKVTYQFIKERIVLTECIADYLWKNAKSFADNFKENHRLKKFRDLLWNGKPPFSMSVEDFSTVHLYKGGFLFSGLLLNKIAHYYSNLGEYEKSKSYAHKGLDIQIQMFGYNYDTMGMIYTLAKSYYYEMNFNEAILYGKKSYSLCKRYPKYSDELKAATCSLLGSIYLDLEAYKKAKRYFEESIYINRKLFGEFHPNVAVGYHNLGRVCKEQGDSKKALTYFRKALRIEKESDNQSASSAATYHSIGKILLAEKDYKNAEIEFLQALALLENYEGSNHIHTGAVYASLGELYLLLEDYEKAYEYYGKVLPIYEQRYEKSHVCMLEVLLGLAYASCQIGKYKESKNYYECIINVYEKDYTLEPLEKAQKYSEIAEVFLRKKQYDLSSEYYKKSFKIMSQILGDKDPIVKEMKSFIDNLDSALGMGNEGISLLDKCVDKWKSNDSNH